MNDQTTAAVAETATGNVVSNTAFKSKDDWINVNLTNFCSTVVGAVEAVEAVEEVKDEDTGEVITAGVAAVRGKKGKATTDVDALKAIADANNITYKEYPNPGMYRMNIGNMLRAAARKRHGLFLPTGADGAIEWKDAPAEFIGEFELKENQDGSKIVKAKPAAEAEGEVDADAAE